MNLLPELVWENSAERFRLILLPLSLVRVELDPYNSGEYESTTIFQLSDLVPKSVKAWNARRKARAWECGRPAREAAQAERYLQLRIEDDKKRQRLIDIGPDGKAVPLESNSPSTLSEFGSRCSLPTKKVLAFDGDTLTEVNESELPGGESKLA